jgi:hypothetical protein
MTMGKKIGLAAFIVTELVIIMIVILAFFRSDMAIDFNQAIISQVFVFITVWGAKASSNFAKKIGEKK